MAPDEEVTVSERLERLEERVADLVTVLGPLIERVTPLLEKAERWSKAKAAKARTPWL